jgi:putative aminopeptidase FrvX
MGTNHAKVRMIVKETALSTAITNQCHIVKGVTTDSVVLEQLKTSIKAFLLSAGTDLLNHFIFKIIMILCENIQGLFFTIMII